MAATMHFDTHAFVQKLKIAGFSSEQVDTLVDLARKSTFPDLVTNQSLDTRLTMFEQRMTIKLGSLIIASMAALVTFLKFFATAA